MMSWLTPTLREYRRPWLRSYLDEVGGLFPGATAIAVVAFLGTVSVAPGLRELNRPHITTVKARKLTESVRTDTLVLDEFCGLDAELTAAGTTVRWALTPRASRMAAGTSWWRDVVAQDRSDPNSPEDD